MTTVIPADRPHRSLSVEPLRCLGGQAQSGPDPATYSRRCFPQRARCSNLLAAAARTSITSHLTSSSTHFSLPIMTPTYSRRIKNLRAEQGNANVADPSRSTSQKPEPGRTQARSSMMSSSSSICFRCAGLDHRWYRASCRAGVETNGFLAIYGPFKVDSSYTTESERGF